MNYTMTIPEWLYQIIMEHSLKDDTNERAGFAFCRISETANETRLLLRDFHPVESRDIRHTDGRSMKIEAAALTKALKHAHDTNQCLVFIHSHPSGFREFSIADDSNEKALFKSAYNRIEGTGPHASIVIPHGGNPIARVWLSHGSSVAVSRIRVIGKQFLFFDQSRICHQSDFFDRQVRAFGQDTQALLSSLHIAIVGAGGTGSASAEQLIRLGVGRLTIYDGQVLEKSNVSRVFGSCVGDAGMPKAELLARLSNRIGLSTKIMADVNHITNEQSAKTLRDADIIFGCTDDQWGRSILNDLAIRYYIPVIDMGVQITSHAGHIHSVCGRVTVIAPGTACLFCRERIAPGRIKAESDMARNPIEAIGLQKEGYAPELTDKDPSVIAFTSSTASLAVTELIQRLTAFMGTDRQSTEVIQLFHQSEVRTNAVKPNIDCKCTQRKIIGIGDTQDFLGVLWA